MARSKCFFCEHVVEVDSYKSIARAIVFRHKDKAGLPWLYHICYDPRCLEQIGQNSISSRIGSQECAVCYTVYAGVAEGHPCPKVYLTKEGKEIECEGILIDKAWRENNDLFHL